MAHPRAQRNLLQLPTFLLVLLLALTHADQTSVIVDTITVAAPTSTTPPSPQYTSSSDLTSAILNSTNVFRYEHNATAVTWNASLATYAHNWASNCVWKHSGGPDGENLAMGFPDITSSVDGWGDERALYNFNTPTGFSEKTGHFTQLVWKATTSTGCAAVDCSGKPGMDGWFVVCEYWPAGNVVGDNNLFFKENVQAQIHANAPSGGVTAASTTASATAASPSASSTQYGIGNEGSSHQVARELWTFAAIGAALVLAGGMI